jgi:hypothetical protein
MIHVSSNVLHNSVEPPVSADSKGRVYQMPEPAGSVFEGPDFEVELQDLLDSISNGLGCVRAVQAAVLIEAAGALLIYGLWLITHLGR